MTDAARLARAEALLNELREGCEQTWQFMLLDEIEVELAAERQALIAEYTRLADPLPGETVLDLMKGAVDEAIYEKERFKSRGGQLDKLDAELNAERQARETLVAEWDGMVEMANKTGPIPGDEIGHVSRWTAVEMCANQLRALLRGAGGQR